MARPEPNIFSQKCGKACDGALASTTIVSALDGSDCAPAGNGCVHAAHAEMTATKSSEAERRVSRRMVMEHFSAEDRAFEGGGPSTARRPLGSESLPRQKENLAWNSITRPASPPGDRPNKALSTLVLSVPNVNGCKLSLLIMLKKFQRSSTFAFSPRSPR